MYLAMPARYSALLLSPQRPTVTVAVGLGPCEEWGCTRSAAIWGRTSARISIIR